MKRKIKVLFTNEIDVEIFDEYFYQMLYENIIRVKSKKKKKNIWLNPVFLKRSLNENIF